MTTPPLCSKKPCICAMPFDVDWNCDYKKWMLWPKTHETHKMVWCLWWSCQWYMCIYIIDMIITITTPSHDIYIYTHHWHDHYKHHTISWVIYVNGIYIARDIHIHVITESGSHLMLVGHIMALPFKWHP